MSSLKMILISLFIFSFTLTTNVFADIQTLKPNKYVYPGEQLVLADGFPSLIKYIPGDSQKPLVIFIPGDSHLARIAYGFPGDNPKDFLSYWLHAAGFGFLGVSYPLENPVFDGVYPNYGIKNWGNQVATIAAHIIAENHLSNRLIVCGWSMGGKISAAVTQAAKAKGLNVSLFVALSADPPFAGLLPKSLTDSIKMLPNGLADRHGVFPWFVNAIAQQDHYNNRTIIPNATYLAQFIGNIPVDLMGTQLHYQNHQFIKNREMTFTDASSLQFSDYPIPAVIHDDSPADAENVLLDSSDWALIRSRVIFYDFLQGKSVNQLSAPEWELLQHTIKTSGGFLTEQVHGTHFFFLGEIGARETAHKIGILYDRKKSIDIIINNLKIKK